MFPEPEKGGRGEKGSVTEQFSGVSRRALPARPRRPGRLRSILIRRFFYGVTLGQAEIPERIPYVRSPHKLLLSADEVVRFLEDFADGPWGQKSNPGGGTGRN
jgi:hypothetical protein